MRSRRAGSAASSRSTWPAHGRSMPTATGSLTSATSARFRATRRRRPRQCAPTTGPSSTRRRRPRPRGPHTAHGHEQALIARIQAPGDTFYSGHEGGFDAGRSRGRGGYARPHAGRALRRAHHLPRPALRRGLGRGAAHPQSRDPERGRVTARQAGPARPRHQRAGHHVRPGDGGAGGRRRDPGGARPRAHRHDAAPRPHRATRAPGDALPHRGLPPPPGPRLLLRRRALHRPGVRALPAQGAGGPGPGGGARAGGRRRHAGPGDDRLLRPAPAGAAPARRRWAIR